MKGLSNSDLAVGQLVKVPHGLGEVVGFEKLEPWSDISEFPEESDSRVVIKLKETSGGYQWPWDTLYYTQVADILEVL